MVPIETQVLTSRSSAETIVILRPKINAKRRRDREKRRCVNEFLFSTGKKKEKDDEDEDKNGGRRCDFHPRTSMPSN